MTAPDAAAIRKIVKGLAVDDARDRLRDYGDATVDVWPGWVTTITPYDFRLDVQVVSDVATEPTTPNSLHEPFGRAVALRESVGLRRVRGRPRRRRRRRHQGRSDVT